MARNNEEAFDGVQFATEYPAQQVADHEVFMSFDNDEDAIAFREWWNEIGSIDFNGWMEERG